MVLQIVIPKKYYTFVKCKLCDVALYGGKAKTKFWYRFNNYKIKDRASRKGKRKIPKKLFHDHYCLNGDLRIVEWNFTFFEQYERHKQLKEREQMAAPT